MERILQRNVRPKKEIAQRVKSEHFKVIVPEVERQIEKEIEVATTITSQRRVFDYYLGFGGTGDALLVLAVCWSNPNAHIVFFGNEGSITLTKDFFRVFNVASTVMSNIMGSPVANRVFDRLKKLPTFRQSAHLADGLYYEDWRNEEKYIPRIINYVPEWREKFGILTNKLIVIAPSASTREKTRQRYLSKQEYDALAKKYLSQGYEVYGIGPDRDFQEYNLRVEGSWWATNHVLRDWKGNITNHSLSDMLRIINSAEELFSTDSMTKTYSMLAGVPTTVIVTRCDGKYKAYGEHVGDLIFLNKKIWPNLKLAKIEDLI